MTKSLLTTSVKYVRLVASTSFIACQVNFTILILACSVFSASNLPLPLTLYLAACVYRHHCLSGWLVNALKGNLIISNSGLGELNGREFMVKKKVMLLPALGLLLQFDSGERHILWRDSVSEKDYRLLLSMFKRELQAPL